MKHAPVYNSDIDITDLYAAHHQYELKKDFYKNYSFLDLISVVLKDKSVLKILLKSFQTDILELKKKNHKNLDTILHAVIKYEENQEIRRHIFMAIGVSYLQFIGPYEDRKLYLKEVNEFINEF